MPTNTKLARPSCANREDYEENNATITIQISLATKGDLSYLIDEVDIGSTDCRSCITNGNMVI